MKKLFLLIPALFCLLNIFGQATYNDGPIELKVKLRDVSVTLSSNSDFTLDVGPLPIPGSITEDEYTIKLWARGNSVGTGWIGGNCNTDEGNPPYITADFNNTFFTDTFNSATVPMFFDLKLDAWEDDLPTDFDFAPSGVPPFISNDCESADGYDRCTFDASTCCVSSSLVGCVLNESDDVRCDADPFKTNLDYRLGPPCQWYDHNYITGSGCTDNVYRPRVESYWRYTKGTACNGTDAIDLGTLTSGVTFSHYNSNECYSNNFAASPGNDVFYTFDITNPIGISISVCGANTNFDTYLYLLDSSCNIDTSNNDGCGNQSEIRKTLCNPGRYYVVVDGNLASSMGTFELVVAEDPSFSFSVAITKQNPLCTGDANGYAVANVTGGQMPYTYAWSGGLPPVDSVAGLSAGAYTVSVTDAEGCQATATVNIVDPPAITVDVDSTNVLCGGANDGSATANPSGGTPPYTYVWNTSPVQTGQTAVALNAGPYTVTVRDANSCSATGTTTVNPTTVIDVLADVTDISCFGEDDGAIDITISGGTPSYTYAWSNGANTEDVTGLEPGLIDFTLTDAQGCIETASFFINEPDVLATNVQDTRNVTCNGGNDGAVDLGVTGGTPPYSYNWSNGSMGEDLLNASGGPFSATVTDANGCVDSSTSGTLTEPPAITSSIAATPAGCEGDNNGAADLTVSGGVGGFTFFWSNFETSEDISDLATGKYTVVIKDDNGCQKVDTVTITGSPALAVQPVTSKPSCIGEEDGVIELNVTGTNPITYQWSNNDTSSTIADLAADTYSVTVTDANNCTEMLTLILDEPQNECSTGGSFFAIPNAFSPNGDGTNDRFDYFASDDVEQVDVMVFNRWGELIYKRVNQPNGEDGWDGTYKGEKVPVGSYAYVMEVEYADPNRALPHQMTGTITVIR